jgi:glycine reductase
MPHKSLKIIHYLNQFYGQIGGEDKAGQPPIIKKGPIGPGTALSKIMEERAAIVATIICGDNYFSENIDKATREIVALLKQYSFDGLIAGPAFNAGRYGIACGAISNEITRSLHIPAVTAMFPENPAVEMFRKNIYILGTGRSVSSMRSILPKMAKFLLKLAKFEKIGFPEEEGYIPQGYKINIWDETIGAKRAINMLLKKVNGEPYVSEVTLPTYDKIQPAPPVSKLNKSNIALVSSGGIVPKGNPDHIKSSNADTYAKYSIDKLNKFESQEYESIHAGYDTTFANENPNRVVPLDVLRQIEKNGKINKLYEYYYVTVGNLTNVSNAKKFGAKIGLELKRNNVNAVILTAT